MSNREYLKIRREAIKIRERIAWLLLVLVPLTIFSHFSNHFAPLVRQLFLIGLVTLTIYFIACVVKFRRLDKLADAEARRLQKVAEDALNQPNGD